MCAGENYHANHHALPGSVQVAIAQGEIDIGFHMLKSMERLGLVWNNKEPHDLPPREELVQVYSAN